MKGAGAFMTFVMGLPDKDAVVKVEDEYVVSFHPRRSQPDPDDRLRPSPQPDLHSTKCKEMATADDPWARAFLDTNVAGFGPYALKEITRGQQMVATARPEYYGDKPFFETVVFREVPASATRLQLLQGGAVDIAQNLAPTEMKSLAGNPEAKVTSIEASQMLWIELNTAFAPLDNIKVRQALNYAMPKDEVVATILQGFGKKMTTFMPDFYPGATAEFYDYDYDIEKAKALLAACLTGSRRSSPTMPATRSKSRSPSSTRRHSKRSASMSNSRSCRPARSSTAWSSAASR